jgi:hypothetical protein
MDEQKFDRLAREVAGASRRRVLAGLAGAALAALGVGGGRGRAQTTVGAIDWTGRFCGGIAGIPCPSGYACVDDPGDACDPTGGGADCGGVCQPSGDASVCAAVSCLEGSVCCDVCGGGQCFPAAQGCPLAKCPGDPPGAGCAATLCRVGETCCEVCGDGVCVPAGAPCPLALCVGEACNQTTCGRQEYCCNWSCSTCAPLGGGCTEQFCGDPGVACGDAVCGAGEYCCNESCGICAPIGGACIQIACL